MKNLKNSLLIATFATLLGAACQPQTPVREDADFKALQAQTAELTSKLAALTETVDTLKTQNDSLLASLSDVSATDDSQNAKSAQLARKLKRLDRMAKELQTAAKAGALDQVVALNDDGTSKKVENVDNKLRDLATQLMLRNEKLEKQMKELQEQSAMLHNDLSTLVKDMPTWMK